MSCLYHKNALVGSKLVLHAWDMAGVTKAATANRTKQVIFWGCSCHSVVQASDYVQAGVVKHVHTAWYRAFCLITLIQFFPCIRYIK